MLYNVIFSLGVFHHKDVPVAFPVFKTIAIHAVANILEGKSWCPPDYSFTVTLEKRSDRTQGSGHFGSP